MLLKPRNYYRPFEYQEAFDFYMSQQQAFWLWTEVSLSKDVQDWALKLTQSEKDIIGNILKSFVQSEVIIGDYWRQVGSIFPKPEVAMMASAFSNMETIHTAGYAYLNETLGLTDFKGFLQDEDVMARLGRLMDLPPTKYEFKSDFDDSDFGSDYLEWKKELAISLASFSAFGEGVSLFSAFAILLSFSLRNLMKGVGEIIEFSIRDESLHSNAGCWLFNQFIAENKDIHGIKKSLYQAARDTVHLEDNFIDSVFQGRRLPNLDPEDLKVYIRHRANNKLQQIGLKPNWHALDKEAIERMSWFDVVSTGVKQADFFAGRVTDYSRGVSSGGWDELFT